MTTDLKRVILLLQGGSGESYIASACLKRLVKNLKSMSCRYIVLSPSSLETFLLNQGETFLIMTSLDDVILLHNKSNKNVSSFSLKT